MGSRRTLILIAAVLVGAVAAWALYTYVSGIENRAYEDAQLVGVYVVKSRVGKGVSGDQALSQKLIDAGQIPKEFRPADAITDPTAIAGKIAMMDLSPGQVVVNGMFVDQQAAFVTFAERLPSDQVAITVQVDQVKGVAGLLVPGDKVNLMVVAQGEGEVATSDVRFLYQNVEILAIGQTAVGEATPGGAGAAGQQPGLITFQVPPEAAQRIAYASTATGWSLYLTLSPRNYVPEDLPPVNAANLIQPGVLTPYATPPG